MKKIRKKIIKECVNSCPFYQISMDGSECGHPYWDDKGAYDNMIIDRDHRINRTIPEKCPLRIKPYEVTLQYTLKKSTLKK